MAKVQQEKSKVPSAYVLVNNGKETIVLNIYGEQIHYGKYPTNSQQVGQIRQRAAMAAEQGNKNYMVEHKIAPDEACTLLIPTRTEKTAPFASQLPADENGNHYPLYGNMFKFEAAPMNIAGQTELVYTATEGYSMPQPLQTGNINMFCIHGQDKDAVADVANSITAPTIVFGNDSFVQ